MSRLLGIARHSTLLATLLLVASAGALYEVRQTNVDKAPANAPVAIAVSCFDLAKDYERRKKIKVWQKESAEWLRTDLAISLATTLRSEHDREVVAPKSAEGTCGEDERTIATRLNADAVLTGTVDRIDGRTVVWLRLYVADVDRSWGLPVVEAEAEDLFDLKFRLARAVDEFLEALVSADAALKPIEELSSGDVFPAEQTQHAIDTGDYSWAYLAANTHLLENGDSAEAWFYLGVAQFGLGHPVSSEYALHQALTLDPNFVEAQVALSEFYSLTFDYVLANDYAGRVLAEDSTNVDALISLADSHFAAGEYRPAREAYGAALQQRPEESEFTFRIGEVLQAEGETDAAVEHYRSVLSADAEHAGAAAALSGLFFSDGLSAYRSGRVSRDRTQFVTAAGLFQQSIDAYPSADAHFLLGQCELNRFDASPESFRSAARDFASSLEVGGERSRSYYSPSDAQLKIAQAHVLAGDYREGLAASSEYLRDHLDPTDAPTALLLGFTAKALSGEQAREEADELLAAAESGRGRILLDLDRLQQSIYADPRVSGESYARIRDVFEDLRATPIRVGAE